MLPAHFGALGTTHGTVRCPTAAALMVRSFGAHSNVRLGLNRQHAHLRRGLPCGLHCHCHMRLGRGARTDLPAQHATCSVQGCALLRGIRFPPNERHGMASQADSVAPCAFRYGYTFLVPALGWVVCKYILSIPLELMTLLTLYGYSLVTFLPSAVRPAASHRIASHRPHPVGVSRCWHRQERSWRVRFCPPARREYSSTLFLVLYYPFPPAGPPAREYSITLFRPPARPRALWSAPNRSADATIGAAITAAPFQSAAANGGGLNRRS